MYLRQLRGATPFDTGRGSACGHGMWAWYETLRRRGARMGAGACERTRAWQRTRADSCGSGHAWERTRACHVPRVLVRVAALDGAVLRAALRARVVRREPAAGRHVQEGAHMAGSAGAQSDQPRAVPRPAALFPGQPAALLSLVHPVRPANAPAHRAEEARWVRRRWHEDRVVVGCWCFAHLLCVRSERTPPR